MDGLGELACFTAGSVKEALHEDPQDVSDADSKGVSPSKKARLASTLVKAKPPRVLLLDRPFGFFSSLALLPPVNRDCGSTDATQVLALLSFKLVQASLRMLQHP